MIIQRGIVTNTVLNIIGSGLPLVFIIVSVPWYLGILGNSRFGIISLIWLLFGYFGLFDFGLSRATANRLAQLRNHDAEENFVIFFTSVSINFAIGMFVGLVFYFSADFILRYTIMFDSVKYIDSEIKDSILLIAFLFPIAMIGGVFVGCLEAYEKFITINLQQIVGTALIQFLPLIGVKTFGPSIRIAIISTIFARFIILLSSGISAFSMFRGQVHFEIRISAAVSLARYGGWVAITNIISPILTGVDQFFIGSMLGANTVPYYSIPFSMANKISIIPGAASRALFPRLSNMNREGASAVASRACATLATTLALICCPAIMFTKFGLAIWISPDFARLAGPVAQILLLGTWVNGIAFVPFSLLQAQGRPDLVAKFHLLELFPFIAFLWVGIHYGGVTGAAYAWLFRVTLDTALLFWANDSGLTQVRNVAFGAASVIFAWSLVLLFDVNIEKRVIIAIFLEVFIMIWALSTDDVLRQFVSGLARRGVARLLGTHP